MNMTDNSLFLMKIEHYYNLRTLLTPFIGNVIFKQLLFTLKDF